MLICPGGTPTERIYKYPKGSTQTEPVDVSSAPLALSVGKEFLPMQVFQSYFIGELFYYVYILIVRTVYLHDISALYLKNCLYCSIANEGE